jgi:class 3 adenylate cyclase
MSTIDPTRDLQKQIQVLTKRLAVCERERLQLESVKDKADRLLRKVDDDRIIISEKNAELAKLYQALGEANAKSEQLLLNVLPEEIAVELKQFGRVKARRYPAVTVGFTDFVAFTAVAEALSVEQLLEELDTCFTKFDSIIAKYNLEKLKTIGDSYMFASGLFERDKSHAADCICAGLEMQRFIEGVRAERAKLGQPYWQMRIGLHSGPVMAGVIGHKKFSFDIWGSTVNLASRMESSGVPGRVNVSSESRDLATHFIDFEARGKIQTKREGALEMFIATGLKSSLQDEHALPNEEFWKVRSGFNQSNAS